MDKVKMGIIGIGNMGAAHAKNILDGKTPEIVLAAVADTNPARREWAKKNLPDTVAIFEDGDQLIDKADVDAIIIATPHYQHPTLAMRAFDRGINVMSEKPAGVFTKQVREMNEKAAKSDVVFAMMFNQRTNCIYRKMRELVQSGELGEIRRVSWLITDWFRTQHYYDSGAWRATWAGEGGGVLLNQCPHNLDLLQWICGMPSKVTAFCHEGKWHDIEVEDDVTAYFEYPNGATGVFITTTGDAPGTNRLEITLDKGKLVSEPGSLTLYKNDVPTSQQIIECKDGFRTPKVEVIAVETDGENPQHVGVLNAFADAILHGGPLVANGVEGINGLMLSNAMHLSSWQGGPVDLPVDEDAFLEELNKRRATSRHKESGSVYIESDGHYGS